MAFDAICVGSLLTILVIGIAMDVIGRKRFVFWLDKVWPTFQFGSKWSLVSYAINIALLLVFIIKLTIAR